MKLLTLLIIIIFLISSSCNKEKHPIPVAEFTYTYINQCEIPSQILFENLSLHGEIGIANLVYIQNL